MRRLAAVLFLTLSLAACERDKPVAVPPAADKLLQASQLRTPLLYLETPLYDPDLREVIPAEFLTQVQQTIQATVNNPYTDTQLRQALAEELDATDIQGALAFYQSPVGQAVLKAENGFRERLNLTDAPPPSPQIQQLQQATRLHEGLKSIFLASANALFDRLTDYDCLPLMQIPGSHIGLNVAKRNKIGFLNKQVQRSLANLYAPLSPSEVDAYLAFATSPTGQRFFTARTRAMDTIGTDFGQRLAEAIAPGIPSCVGSLKVSSTK